MISEIPVQKSNKWIEIFCYQCKKNDFTFYELWVSKSFIRYVQTNGVGTSEHASQKGLHGAIPARHSKLIKKRKDRPLQTQVSHLWTPRPSAPPFLRGVLSPPSSDRLPPPSGPRALYIAFSSRRRRRLRRHCPLCRAHGRGWQVRLPNYLYNFSMF